ncbi:hypothetical protein [Wolbachia endosymbiont (group B) of Villa cingulata]
MEKSHAEESKKYITKKLNAVVAAKKHSITAVAKICCISKKALN